MTEKVNYQRNKLELNTGEKHEYSISGSKGTI